MNLLQENRINTILEKLLFEKKKKKKKSKKKKRDRCLRIADRKFDKPSAYKSGAVVRCRQGDIWKGVKEEIQVLNEKEKETLRKWFKRNKGTGWVDCNTGRKDKKTGKMKYKPCGRKKGEKRAKYPACKPTPSKCKDKGKGKTWGKKSKQLSEVDYNSIFRVEAYFEADSSKRSQSGILSDIRSIPGVTIVGSRPLPVNPSKEKSILNLKVDPYPFTKMDDVSAIDSVDYIALEIRKIPGVKTFKIISK